MNASTGALCFDDGPVTFTDPPPGLEPLCLLANAERYDEISVSLDVLLLQIVEQATSLADEHEQTTTRVVVLRVLTKMLSQVGDTL